MNVTHTTTPDGRPLTIALYDGMASRLPGHLSAENVMRTLQVNRAIDVQQRKA